MTEDEKEKEKSYLFYESVSCTPTKRTYFQQCESPVFYCELHKYTLTNGFEHYLWHKSAIYTAKKKLGDQAKK